MFDNVNKFFSLQQKINIYIKRIGIFVFSFLLLTIFILSTLFSLFSGTSAETGSSLFEGAEKAIEFCLRTGGGICLWCAVIELMERCGIAEGMSKLLRPLLRRLFPRASRDKETMDALSQNVSANLLGLGNAATPAGIRAAKGMARLGERAKDELCLLVVLNTASIQLIPSTIAAVRASLGAVSAFDILPAVWISSLFSVCAGLGAAGLLRSLWR